MQEATGGKSCWVKVVPSPCEHAGGPPDDIWSRVIWSFLKSTEGSLSGRGKIKGLGGEQSG